MTNYNNGSQKTGFVSVSWLRKVMIRRTVHKFRQDAHCQIKQNLQYWLSRAPQERLAAVDLLRRQMYGDTEGLQRVARVVQRSQG